MKLIAELILDGTPDLPNVNMYQHWAIKRNGAIKWKRKVMAACAEARISGLGLDHAVLTFTRRSCKECDFDGLVASFKHCQDGLVYANVIVDDKPINIGQPSYKWEFRARKFGNQTSIKIEVED